MVRRRVRRLGDDNVKGMRRGSREEEEDSPAWRKERRGKLEEKRGDD